jgi:3'(2'), 5'-bisphosphate nucleotidase
LPHDLQHLLAVSVDAARRAGDEIMKVYAQDFTIRRKDDASPVTLADEHAEVVILKALAEAAPDILAISEEHATANGLPIAAPPLFWLVDPLDGTKEFVNRNGEFTVNIGLIENGVPILGVVHVPCSNVTYAGAGLGTATRQKGDDAAETIAARLTPPEGVTVVHSRSHKDDAALDEYLVGKKVAGMRVSGSSVKFCLVADGEADLYPRFGPTMEWDTAAAHAVLLAAGGEVTNIDGTPFRYGKPGFRNPGFIARGRG